MRFWSMAQVLLCVALGGFVASYVVAGFAFEHPAVLAFTRLSAASLVLAFAAAICALMVDQMRAVHRRFLTGRQH